MTTMTVPSARLDQRRQVRQRQADEDRGRRQQRAVAADEAESGRERIHVGENSAARLGMAPLIASSRRAIYAVRVLPAEAVEKET